MPEERILVLEIRRPIEEAGQDAIVGRDLAQAERRRIPDEGTQGVTLADGDQNGRWFIGAVLDPFDQQAASGAAVRRGEQISADRHSAGHLLMRVLMHAVLVDHPHLGAAWKAEVVGRIHPGGRVRWTLGGKMRSNPQKSISLCQLKP